MFEKWRIKEHMEVTDAAGQHIGTVDSVDGDTIKLTRTDSADGQHHLLDFSTVDRIEDNRVWLKEGTAAPQGVNRQDTLAETPATPRQGYEVDAAERAGYGGHEATPNVGGDAQVFSTSGFGKGVPGSGSV